MNHIHQYIRIRGTKNYRCAIAGCPHKITGSYKYLIGRTAQCPYCGITFTINNYDQTRRATIHCGHCSRNGKLLELSIAEDSLDPIDETQNEVFESLLKEKNIT